MSRGLTWLWALYIGTLPFHRVWTLPGLGTKLQPPELIFLALVLVAIVVYRHGEVRARLQAVDIAVVLWGFANLLALSMTRLEPYVDQRAGTTTAGASGGADCGRWSDPAVPLERRGVGPDADHLCLQ